MLNLDKSSWQRVKFGEVVKNINDYYAPAADGELPYVAGPHIDAAGMAVTSYGLTSDDNFPPTFKRKFQPRDVLLHSRGIEKIAATDRVGVTGEKLFVLRTTDSTVLDQQFLPILLRSPMASDYLKSHFTGSVNRFLNWKPLAAWEFDLPTMEEQKRIAALLWTVERHATDLAKLRASSATAASQLAGEALENLGWETSVGDVIDKERPLCYGVVQPGVDVEDGVGLVRVLDLESGAPDMGQLKRVSQEVDHQYRRSRIQQGDVLVSVVGTIGRTWAVTSEFEGCNIARALARISPESSKMAPAFLELALTTRRVQDSLLREAFESARKTLNLSALSKVVLPSATLEEQSRIVADHRHLADAAQAVADAGAATLNLRAALLSSIFGDS